MATSKYTHTQHVILSHTHTHTHTHTACNPVSPESSFTPGLQSKQREVGEKGNLKGQWALKGGWGGGFS